MDLRETPYASSSGISGDAGISAFSSSPYYSCYALAMPITFRVALGDYNSSAIAHQAIPEGLRLASTAEHAIEGVCVHTASIRNPDTDLRDYDGFWCVT